MLHVAQWAIIGIFSLLCVCTNLRMPHRSRCAVSGEEGISRATLPGLEEQVSKYGYKVLGWIIAEVSITKYQHTCLASHSISFSNFLSWKRKVG